MNFKLLTAILIIVSVFACSTLNKERIYIGDYRGKTISINFESSKNGKFIINDSKIVPFEYEIEKSQIDPQTGKKRKVDIYVYRFIVDANYDLNIPLGFYEIGQKGGNVLRGTDGLTLKRAENKTNQK